MSPAFEMHQFLDHNDISAALSHYPVLTFDQRANEENKLQTKPISKQSICNDSVAT